MTSGLRKTHLIMWLMIAVISPIILIITIKNLNIFDSESVIVLSNTNQKKVLVEDDFFKISLDDLSENHSIEIIVKKPLKASETSVFSLNKKGEKDLFLGQITTTGVYTFKCNQVSGIAFFDTIKNEFITKYTF